jgi:hypothetical protein
MEEGNNGCSKRQEAMNIGVKTASLQAGKLRIDGDVFCLNPET